MKRTKCPPPLPQLSSLADRVYTAAEVEICLFDLIQRRAYELYEARGQQQGHDVDDWLKAEQEITPQFGPIANIATDLQGSAVRRNPIDPPL